MPRTAERIAQAEDGIAQVQTVLEHAQSALEVAGNVEEAARRSRRVRITRLEVEEDRLVATCITLPHRPD